MRTEYSRMGIASLVMSFFPATFLVGAYWLAIYLLSKEPPGADETGYAFGVFAMLVLTILLELVALGLGVAGTFQRRRKKPFAFLGIVCSVLVLVMISAQIGFADVASVIAGMMETQPKVVSPGNS